MGKLKDANKKIEEKVVSGYMKVEDTVVGGYKKVEDKFVDKFLRKDGETIEEAKERKRKRKQTNKLGNCFNLDSWSCRFLNYGIWNE